MKSAQYIINTETLLGFICSICNNMVYSKCFHGWLKTHTDRLGKKRFMSVMEVLKVRVRMRLVTGQKERRKWRRKALKEGQREVFWRGRVSMKSAGFSTRGGIDAILDGATYEQVCCAWSLWPRLHFLHGYTSHWGASDPGRERQASTPLRSKMKGHPHCSSVPWTSRVRRRSAVPAPPQEYSFRV